MNETEQQIDDFFTDFKAPEQPKPPQIEEPEVEDVKLFCCIAENIPALSKEPVGIFAVARVGIPAAVTAERD